MYNLATRTDLLQFDEIFSTKTLKMRKIKNSYIARLSDFGFFFENVVTIFYEYILAMMA